MVVVRTDDLNDDVELSCCDDDIACFPPGRDRVGDRARAYAAASFAVCAGPNADERHGVETKTHRVGNADDLQDIRRDKPSVPIADRALRHAQLLRDATKWRPPVFLEYLDET